MQFGVAHEARKVNPSIGQLEAEHLLVACVERVLPGYDLVHRHAESPHVCRRPISLQVDHFRGPVDQSVGHRLSDKHFAEELVRVPSSIEFNFSKLAQQGRIVVLDKDRTWFDRSVHYLTVVQCLESFRDVYKVLKCKSG